MIKKLKRKIKRFLGIKEIYRSETDKVRHLVQDFCIGKGCDIGFGGDKIKKENCLGIDYEQPYAHVGKEKVDIACDVMHEPIPVKNNTFDYVYSSHLIEDFDDTLTGVKEFIRILKDGGNLILVFPDQRKYEEHCKQTGQPLNIYHKHSEMGLTYMLNVINKAAANSEVLFKSNCDIDYNVVIVAKIFKNGIN